MKAVLLGCVISFLALNLYGCWFIVGGAVGALGGYAISKDTVQGETDKPYDNLWDAALTISKIRGAIKQEDISRGYIELEADSSRVWIRVIRLTRSVNRLRVSSRKFHLPNLSLAQDIFTKIMEQAQ